MRNKCLFLFLFLALMFGAFSNTVFAADAETGVEEDHLWHNCKKDTDCVFIGDACHYGSINKKYKARGERFSREFYQDMTCTEHPSLEGIKGESYCKKQQVECKNRKASERGEICFDDEGKCTLKP